MRLFWVEFKKLLTLFRADPKSAGAGFVAPSLMLIMFYLIFGHLASFPIAIINQDQGAWGARLQSRIEEQISPLGKIPYFKQVELPLNEALLAYQQGRLVGVLIIPADFSARIDQADSPVIEYHLNNYNADFAKNLRLYLQEGMLDFYRTHYPEVDIRMDEIYAAPSQVEWIDIIASGVLLFAFVVGGMFNFLYLFFKEKQHKTLLSYQLAPQTILPSFAARTCFALLVSCATGLCNAGLALLLTGNNFFPYLLRFSPMLMLISLTYIFAACIVSLHMKIFYGAVLGVMFSAILLWIISGGMVHIRPTGILGFIATLIPNTYALDLLRGVLFDPAYAGYHENIAILALFFLVFLLAAVTSYRESLWKPGSASKL
jgi:ABC-2 type transport system permease protein